MGYLGDAVTAGLAEDHALVRLAIECVSEVLQRVDKDLFRRKLVALVAGDGSCRGVSLGEDLAVGASQNGDEIRRDEVRAHWPAALVARILAIRGAAMNPGNERYQRSAEARSISVFAPSFLASMVPTPIS